MVGACVARESVHGRGCAWQGAYMVGDVRGVEHAWERACVARGGVHGRGG